jgi:purine-binding chemotaxis protein CheW
MRNGTERKVARLVEGRAEACAVFELAGAWYALPLGVVVEVGRVPATTRVPNTTAPLVGVANWHGRVLAVLDLGPLLGAGPVRRGAGARLVVCRLGAAQRAGATQGIELGLVADAVAAVHADPLELDAVLPTLAAGPASLLAGQVRLGDRLAGVLSPAALLTFAGAVVAAA